MDAERGREVMPCCEDGSVVGRHGALSFRPPEVALEVIPDGSAVWLVTYNHFNFVKDQNEWVGTKVHFDISQEGNKTQLLFTHEGLVSEFECYDVCSPAWTHYVQDSLLPLITTGKGHPNQKESETKTAMEMKK